MILIKSTKKEQGNIENTIANIEEKNPNGVDIVIKDKYFITQINDIYYNFDKYEGKTIQIDGFPLTHENYTFIARYGPGCCVGDGYGILEYQYNKEIKLTDVKDWIRVIGILKKE